MRTNFNLSAYFCWKTNPFYYNSIAANRTDDKQSHYIRQKIISTEQVIPCTAVQRQTAVTAYFSSKQLLLFAIAGTSGERPAICTAR